MNFVSANHRKDMLHLIIPEFQCFFMKSFYMVIISCTFIYFWNQSQNLLEVFKAQRCTSNWVIIIGNFIGTSESNYLKLSSIDSVPSNRVQFFEYCIKKRNFILRLIYTRYWHIPPFYSKHIQWSNLLY